MPTGAPEVAPQWNGSPTLSLGSSDSVDASALRSSPSSPGSRPYIVGAVIGAELMAIVALAVLALVLWRRRVARHARARSQRYAAAQAIQGTPQGAQAPAATPGASEQPPQAWGLPPDPQQGLGLYRVRPPDTGVAPNNTEGVPTAASGTSAGEAVRMPPMTQLPTTQAHAVPSPASQSALQQQVASLRSMQCEEAPGVPEPGSSAPFAVAAHTGAGPAASSFKPATDAVWPQEAPLRTLASPAPQDAPLYMLASPAASASPNSRELRPPPPALGTSQETSWCGTWPPAVLLRACWRDALPCLFVSSVRLHDHLTHWGLLLR
jgi:hypothetical protein